MVSQAAYSAEMRWKLLMPEASQQDAEARLKVLAATAEMHGRVNVYFHFHA